VAGAIGVLPAEGIPSLKSLTPETLADIQAKVTTFTVCWRVERQDGVLILGTEHDHDITIESDSPSGSLQGTYYAQTGITGSNIRSGSDLDVDNLEVDGPLVALADTSTATVGVSVIDIESGRLDDATVTLFAVNWTDPDRGQIVLRHGNLGEIRRTSEGRYYSELRGLGQRLQQQIIETYSQTCPARLGDSRCQFNIAAHTITGTVTSVTSRLRFNAGMDTTGEDAMYTYGKVTFTSGENEGTEREVRNASVGDVFGNLQVFEPFPLDIEIGDTFNLEPGCDKTAVQCRLYNNMVNFRGHGLFVPTQGAAFGVATHSQDIIRDD
jgi:uncharacterized phage protein (TIGR02218 family)